jgi:hypothetical protein
MQGKEADFPSRYHDIGHILHDLAQPLAAATGLVDLLLLELDEHDKVFQEIQLISLQLEKVMEIIGEVRRIAREAAEHERTAKNPRPASIS